MKQSKSFATVLKFTVGTLAAGALVVASVCHLRKEDKGKRRMACMRNHPSGKDKA